MGKPGLVVTGASGFLGSQLVRKLRKEYRLYALGRRNPRDVGLEEGPDLRWFRVDIGDRDRLQEVFYAIRAEGGAEQLLHMAAYYDFTGDDDPEYDRTNVVGTRNLLEVALDLRLHKFVFFSSVAACQFPPRGEVIDEATAPAGSSAYARSKRAGEEMVRTWSDRIPSCIVRPAAIFSEWCEYEPLYEFIGTWCSRRWDSTALGGRGESAVPYLHVSDLVSFCLRVVERGEILEPNEVLLASPNGSTSHRELHRAISQSFFGKARTPILVPRQIAGIGISLKEWWGRRRGQLPFERSWMVEFIDKKLHVDASRTRRRLDWAPNPDLEIDRCIPAMIKNLRQAPDEWRLRAARKRARRTSVERGGRR